MTMLHNNNNNNNNNNYSNNNSNNNIHLYTMPGCPIKFSSAERVTPIKIFKDTLQVLI